MSSQTLAFFDQITREFLEEVNQGNTMQVDKHDDFVMINSHFL